MKQTETPKNEDLKADIVVIGGGGAGLAGAVSALEKGANVMVLEKRRVPGGNSSMAEGFFAAESPAQKRMNIDADRDVLFKKAMDYAHWKTNPRIVRAFVDKSGDTVRWLEEKGLKLDWIPPMYPNQTPLTWHCLKKGGAEVVKVLQKNCKALGGRVLRQAAAKRIFIDEKGRVTGVLSRTKEKEIKLITKSVVIATGGYGGNKELLNKYYSLYNDNMHNLGLPLMGDGLLMAIEIGAATEGLGIVQLNGQYVPGSLHLRAVAQEPNMVWVNSRGERFADETITFNFPERGNAVIRQPENVTYSLFDDKIRRNIIEHGTIKGIGVLFLQARIALPELDKELQTQAQKGMVKMSDSLDEIAEWMGVAPEILNATVNEYNSSCEKGHDEIFAKDRRYLAPLRTPPYYAIKCWAGYLGTIGGIKINQHMEVLDQRDKPIPGLYDAGSDTGGWESDTYCLSLSGSTFGFAINSGRIAGENAAKYVLGN
jgi:fumarate reductase flavoprotein subunit